MATLYIEEYTTAPIINNGQIMQMAKQPSVAQQTVAISGTSAQSAAFDANTKYVRIHTDAVCSFLFGSDPTATTSDPRMAASQTEYFAVPGGYKVAVITNT